MTVFRAPARESDEPLYPRKLSLTIAENEAIDRVVADQGIGLSQLVVDTILSPARPMSSADCRRLAAELMMARTEMSRALLTVREKGAPADEEFVERIEDLTIRFYNLTEDLAVR